MGEGLMAQAVEVMALGMGTVFVFLTLLVLTVSFMSNALKDFGFGADEQPPTPGRKSSVGSAPVDPKVRQAITLAIAKYRREH